MYCLVCIFWVSFDDKWFTYKIPDNLINECKKGAFVKVPFKNIEKIWIVIDILNNSDLFDTKEVLCIMNKWLNNDYTLELLSYISSNYITPIHNSLSIFYPKNLVWKLEKNKFKLSKSKEYTYNNPDIVLSESQENIYNSILTQDNNKFLLYWVTWSWKTEIYIKLIKEYTSKWKQVLLLIPEIILTNQINKRLIEHFWKDIVIINSTITDANKTKIFSDIYLWEAKIIIWTRSALFYPYKDLWLIIVDEEHDNSYISDNSPRYNWIEIANKITELNDSKLLLASWTPSIESMYKTFTGEYKLLNLLEKYKK